MRFFEQLAMALQPGKQEDLNMPISECCSADVVCCRSDDTLETAAALMRKHHVGALVVLQGGSEAQTPVGILTDRDIVIETVATGLDVSTFTAGDIMSEPLITVEPNAGFVETLRLMCEHAVRRLPVVSREGLLSGIVSAEDLLELLAKEVATLARAGALQRDRERKARR